MRGYKVFWKKRRVTPKIFKIPWWKNTTGGQLLNFDYYKLHDPSSVFLRLFHVSIFLFRFTLKVISFIKYQAPANSHLRPTTSHQQISGSAQPSALVFVKANIKTACCFIRYRSLFFFCIVGVCINFLFYLFFILERVTHPIFSIWKGSQLF